jgi:hypothetical protein
VLRFKPPLLIDAAQCRSPRAVEDALALCHERRLAGA